MVEPSHACRLEQTPEEALTAVIDDRDKVVRTLWAEIARLEGVVEGHAAVLRTQDEVYRERDALVAALSKLWPSHLAWHGDPDWEDGWRNIVCIHSPVGQLTWHIQDDERPQFAHLLVKAEHWDGHTTAEKYARLAALEVP